MSYLIMRNGEVHEVAEEAPPIDCFRCGICCVCCRPKVGDREIIEIANSLRISKEVFVHNYTRMSKSGERILDNGGSQCPFLRWEKESSRAECAIYSFRPQACRNWIASLSRPECQEGLRKLKPDNKIILPNDIYSSGEEINRLSGILEDEQQAE